MVSGLMLILMFGAVAGIFAIAIGRNKSKTHATIALLSDGLDRDGSCVLHAVGEFGEVALDVEDGLGGVPHKLVMRARGAQHPGAYAVTLRSEPARGDIPLPGYHTLYTSPSQISRALDLPTIELLELHAFARTYDKQTYDAAMERFVRHHVIFSATPSTSELVYEGQNVEVSEPVLTAMRRVIDHVHMKQSTAGARQREGWAELFSHDSTLARRRELLSELVYWAADEATLRGDRDDVLLPLLCSVGVLDPGEFAHVQAILSARLPAREHLTALVGACDETQRRALVDMIEARAEPLETHHLELLQLLAHRHGQSRARALLQRARDRGALTLVSPGHSGELTLHHSVEGGLSDASDPQDSSSSTKKVTSL